MSFGLQRARMLLVTLLAALIAVFAGRIFDRFVPTLLIAVLLPAVVAFVVMRRGLTVRRVALLAAVVASVAIVVALNGGDPADLGAAFAEGFARMLSTDWPSPDTPDLVGTTAFVLAMAAALAVDSAGRLRFHLTPLIPLCIVAVLGIAASAPRSVHIGWLAAIAVLTLTFAMLRTPDTRTDSVTAPTAISTNPYATPQQSEPDLAPAVGLGAGLADRIAVLRGERRMVPVIVLAALLAAAISMPLDFTRRSDPRRNEPADRTAALFDPIESTLALRAIDPPIDLHTISNLSGGSTPLRWRTTALDNFTGERWAPTSTLRPIGRRLGADSASTIRFNLSFLNDTVSLIPVPGRAVTIDGARGTAVETDESRTTVRLIERPDSDLVLDVTAAQPPLSLSVDDAGAIAPRPVDDQVSALSEFASSIAGNGTLAEQLQRIEGTMRNDFVLSSSAPGAGQQQALIERFLRETQQGTAEQFATGYVLLARALGVDARVATGFILDPATATSGPIVVTSAHAAVWPEVQMTNGSWVALDPVPASEEVDVTPPPEEPAVQTPAAAQPPIAPPPDPDDDTLAEENIDEERAANTSATITRFVKRYGAVTGIFVLPILFAILLVIGVKFVRRRRRLRAAAAADRVRGAWALATDHLVDAGLDIEASATNGEIAKTGSSLAGASRHELARLASMSNAVTFGHPPRVDVLADDAAGLLRALERTMANDRTVRERAQWRLSARSLRRKTRSPVRD